MRAASVAFGRSARKGYSVATGLELYPGRTRGFARASSPWRNSGCIRPALHPAWLRCSSLKYFRYSRSSRLASRAHHRPRCDAGLSPRAVRAAGVVVTGRAVRRALAKYERDVNRRDEWLRAKAQPQPLHVILSGPGARQSEATSSEAELFVWRTD